MFFDPASHFGKHLCRSMILGLLVLWFGGCQAGEPVRIGFAGELTGKRGELGVAGRDGAQLAVDLINEKGGLGGRPLELIIKDDQGTPAIARQVDGELVEQGVVAIIGHFTSEQTAAVVDQINQAEVVLLSPTSSSSQFSHKDDYFFRVIPSTDLFGKLLATHIYHNRKIRHLTGIYDLSNRTFTESFWRSVQIEFEQLGGQVTPFFTFTSNETDLKKLMTAVAATEPEALIFIGSAIDVALMAQYSRQQGLEAPFFSTAWAQTNHLLEKGGRAVEGLELYAVYNPHNPFLGFQTFIDQFERRYNRPPDFAAVYAYESVLVLVEALKQTGGEADGLPEALAGIKNLEGVQGRISLNQYGDVERDIYIAVVKDGRFEIIETVSVVD